MANTDPLNGVTALAYDAQDNLTQVKDPRGVTTGYQYDWPRQPDPADQPGHWHHHL
ncbi:RHS Repeat protein [compost metagenome]